MGKGFVSVACLCVWALAGNVLAQQVVDGVVTWSQRVELGMLVSGIVSQVHVRPGQRVGKGDTLVELDDRGFGSQVQRWLAEHRHAKGLVAEAEREDERAAELYDRTVLSDFERNQAMIALDGARARLALASARLVDARLDLERSRIRAPFDGVVLHVSAVPGQTVNSELQVQPLVALADSNLAVSAEVDAASAARLTPGQIVRLIVRGERFDGRVTHVGLEPLPTNDGRLRYALQVDVDPGQAPGLRVGETVSVEFE
ncbi:MAG: efflux RND transporter periplasmic adaptor subunit [Gammaproteobacteria bacterium]|nr:efflux RND transporter periplasmic adaptor subunit [Gammaproteobacteria bacterium]